jgi:aryl-alcohol dehydrogenase-like predicted oxidoreductase
MTGDRSLSRRDVLKLGLGAGVALVAGDACGRPSIASTPTAAAPSQSGAALVERLIPSSGERVPVIGIGTARSYDHVSTPEEMSVLRGVLREFPRLGGRVIDTAPSYGQAETIVGDLLGELGNRDRYFIATKVNVGRNGTRAAAVQQMETSMRTLRIDRLDLMQVHNLASPAVVLPMLDEWKAAKRIRYLGLTTQSDAQYPELESIIRSRPVDFIQVDLAIDNRASQDRLIPAAADKGVAVLINLPFGRQRVFQKVQGKPLPDWAKEIDATSWAQIFLKYIISNPAVTAVIPGTATMPFLIDNIAAGKGRLPDAAMRKRIEAYFDAL